MTRRAATNALGAFLLAAAGLSAWRLLVAVRQRKAEAQMAQAAERLRQKDYAGAAGLLSRALEHLPSSRRFKALCMRAEAEAWLKDERLAAEDLRAAQRLDPSAWDSYYGLARIALLDTRNCHAGLGALDSALRKSKELYWFKSRELADVHRLKWRCYQTLGDLERSAAEMGQELGARAANGEASGENVRYALMNRAWANYMLYEKLMARLSQGEWEKIYAERTGRDPKVASASKLKAWTESLPYRHLAQAESDADSSLAMGEDSQLRLLRARILVSAGRGPEASRDLALLEQNPATQSNPEYWLLKASAEGQQKDFKDALASVDRSLDLDPKNGEAAELKQMLRRLAPKPKRKRSR